MRRITLCAALIFGSCGCAITPARSTESLLISRHAVLVDTPHGAGSGFPITEDAFITAWHVVFDSRAEQITVDGWIVNEMIQLKGTDVALLFTGIHGLDPWPLAKLGPRPGQSVWKSGYSQGLHWWTAGIGTEDDHRVALDVFAGDSGGPVFDAQGRVLGIIVSMGWNGEHIIEHHAWIVPIDRILSALPEGIFEQRSPSPLPVAEQPWDRFLRLRKERLGY